MAIVCNPPPPPPNRHLTRVVMGGGGGLCIRRQQLGERWTAQNRYTKKPRLHFSLPNGFISVPDPGKGVCADPVNRGAILEGGGPGPPGGNKERQLSPNKGRGKT